MPERYLGRTLGKYRLDAIAGSGGFAWVFKAFDRELEIPVALKILKPQFAADPTFEQRFRREATTAAKLRHPNIVKIFAVGRDEDVVYLAMDFLPSGLTDRMAMLHLLPEAMIARIGAEVASALAFAHAQGVIHRDIKADNILFDEHGNAVVADFGIARAMSGYAEQTGTNMVVGTPHYFSPEQARARTLDGRSDLYSLGVTLYRAATGNFPFTGDDWYEIARHHIETTPAAPRLANAALSDQMERIILRCLAKDPAERFASADELRNALLPLARAGDGSALMPTIAIDSRLAAGIAAAPRPTRRRLAIGGGVGLAILVVAAIALARRAPPAVSTGAGAARATILPPPVISAPGRANPSPTPVSGATTAVAPPTPVVENRRALTLNAPPAAHILVNGVRVGEGRWRSDTLRPGTYQLAAEVESPEGCTTARDTAVIKLAERGAKTVKLQPRPCGLLQIEARPAGATFSLSTADSALTRRGTLPLGAPLVLPEGKYRLTVEAPLCAQYVNENVHVAPNAEPTKVRVPLLCERSPEESLSGR